MTTTGANYQTIMSQPQEHYDILVVGKSGNGKSALCNTLIGIENKFAVGRGMSTTTTTAQSSDRTLRNMTVRVIDTPDVTNCNMDEAERRAEVQKWKNLLVGPHPSLVLVAVRCDVRYTTEELAVFREIQRLWAGNSLTRNLVVAFTFGDRQDYDIKKDVSNPFPELGQLLRLTNKRHLVFINKESENREDQARQCFSMLKPADRGCCPDCVLS